jgi:hypothetical protein
MRGQSISEVSSVISRKNTVDDDTKYLGAFEVVCRDKDGNEKWREVVKNSLTHQGSEYVLKCAFDDAYTRITDTGWYYALYTAARDATATAATATTSELGSTGYGRLVSAAPTFDQNPSYWRASFESKTFSPGANDWASCWGLGIVNASSGNGGTVFLAFAAFSVARDLAPNDTLTVQYRNTLSSP